LFSKKIISRSLQPCQRKMYNHVMLSEAKHLAAPRDKPFAEFTPSGTNVLKVTT